MHGVSVQPTAGWVDVGELREEAEIGVLVEVLQGDDVVLSIGGCPVKEKRVWQEGAIRAIVVAPRDTLLAGNLEDAGGVDCRLQEAVVVLAVAVRGTGNGAEAVGVGRLGSYQFLLSLIF